MKDDGSESNESSIRTLSVLIGGGEGTVATRHGVNVGRCDTQTPGGARRDARRGTGRGVKSGEERGTGSGARRNTRRGAGRGTGRGRGKRRENGRKTWHGKRHGTWRGDSDEVMTVQSRIR